MREFHGHLGFARCELAGEEYPIALDAFQKQCFFVFHPNFPFALFIIVRREHVAGVEVVVDLLFGHEAFFQDEFADAFG